MQLVPKCNMSHMQHDIKKIFYAKHFHNARNIIQMQNVYTQHVSQEQVLQSTCPTCSTCNMFSRKYFIRHILYIQITRSQDQLYAKCVSATCCTSLFHNISRSKKEISSVCNIFRKSNESYATCSLEDIPYATLSLEKSPRWQHFIDPKVYLQHVIKRVTLLQHVYYA